MNDKRQPTMILDEMLTLMAQGERRTRIMYGANLSHAMLKRNIGWLTRKAFVRARHDGTFEVTKAGREFHQDLRGVNRHFALPESSELVKL